MANPNLASSTELQQLIEEAKQSVDIASRAGEIEEVVFWEDRRLRLLAKLEEALQRERLEAKRTG